MNVPPSISTLRLPTFSLVFKPRVLSKDLLDEKEGREREKWLPLVMFSPHDVEVESLMAVSRCRTGLDSRLGYGKERPTQKNGRPVHPTPLSSTGRFRNIEVNRRQRGARAHRHTRSGNTTVSCREFQVRTAKDLE